MIDQGCLPVFTSLLTHQKNSIQKEAAWTISNVTAGNANQIQAVINNGLIPHVIDIIAKVTDGFLAAFTNFIVIVAGRACINVLVAYKLNFIEEVTEKLGSWVIGPFQIWGTDLNWCPG